MPAAPVFLPRAVAFLAGVYGRTIHVPGMPGDFPGESPRVLGLSDRID
ncbi:hypothetical protein ACWDFL_11835 [Streptomyces bungoensis]